MRQTVSGAARVAIAASHAPCRRTRPAARSAYGDDWVELWLCQSCGWVACSDDSPNRHAQAHYEETDHPIAVRLRPGPRSRWCYVHHRIV